MADTGTVEEQLVEAQRLANVGLLAGGIAHDFNNVLTVILTNLMFVRERLDDRPDVREDLQEIEVAARWGAALTRQLLTYARKQPAEPQVMDLNELALRTDRLLRRLIGEHIELLTTCQPAPALIRADLGQVEQVLVNLGLNARDAMPSGGRLTIEVTAADAGRVGLTMSDTGHGMTHDVLARIAEPLFTTKPVGRGTGLGLAISYGIVRRNGGDIEVSSAPGEGSIFRLSFPRVEHDGPLAPSPPPPAARGGSETILLAEDEAVVRSVAARTLQGLGYRVLEAADGREALELAARYAGPIHLLVTDIVMPHLSGRELADQLRHERPGLQVLFTSGYPADAFSAAALRNGGELLDKPYDPAGLAARVREMLDGEREGAGNVS